MADNNPLRAVYLTCTNEIRRLVVRASVEYHQSNAYKLSSFTFPKELFKEFYPNFHDTEETDKLSLWWEKAF